MDPTQNPVNTGVPGAIPQAPVVTPSEEPVATPEPQAPVEQPVVPPVVTPAEGTGEVGGVPPTTPPAV